MLVSQAFRQEKYLARIRESSVSEDPDEIRFYASRSSIELFLEDGYEISHLTLISTNRRTFGQEWQAAAELLRFHETLKNMSEAMLEAIIRTMRFCGESGPDAPLDVIMPASDNACRGFLHDLAVACRSSVKIDPVSGTRTIVRTSKTELCSLSKLLMLSAMHLDRILRKRSILYRAFCEVITGPDPVKAGCAKAVARTLEVAMRQLDLVNHVKKNAEQGGPQQQRTAPAGEATRRRASLRPGDAVARLAN